MSSLLVLGTAQDGGVPHMGCGCATCAGALVNPATRRLVSCLAVTGQTGRTLVVDATPDLREQSAMLAEHQSRTDLGFDALLITHAHVGHYLGLAFLGREGVSAKALPVFATTSMHAFLRANRPWSYLIERGEIVPQVVEPGVPFLFDGVEVEPISVPHRSEDTDTLGLRLRGPGRRVLWMSDIDDIDDPIIERIRGVDLAFLDGTFYDNEEMPDRDLRQIPHPWVRRTVGILEGVGTPVRFIHLNHSNPLLHPDEAARPQLPEGFTVAFEGEVHTL